MILNLTEILVEKAKSYYYELKKQCPHTIKSSLKESKWNQYDYGHAYCITCGTDFGCYCPPSPTQYCQYDDINDPCHDTCLHCGNPEERK